MEGPVIGSTHPPRMNLGERGDRSPGPPPPGDLSPVLPGLESDSQPSAARAAGPALLIMCQWREEEEEELVKYRG